MILIHFLHTHDSGSYSMPVAGASFSCLGWLAFPICQFSSIARRSVFCRGYVAWGERRERFFRPTSCRLSWRPTNEKGMDAARLDHHGRWQKPWVWCTSFHENCWIGALRPWNKRARWPDSRGIGPGRHWNCCWVRNSTSRDDGPCGYTKMLVMGVMRPTQQRGWTSCWLVMVS